MRPFGHDRALRRRADAHGEGEIADPLNAELGIARTKRNLLIHESPLTDALFLLVSKSDEVTTT